MKIIAIEGNIGAGKTTVIRKLAELDHGKKIVIVDEPIDDWLKCKNVDGVSRFELFKSGKNSAFEFQLYAQMTRIVRMNEILKAQDANENVLIVVERTVDAGNAIFGLHLVSEGVLSLSEHEEIERICKNLKTWQEDKIFVINTPPAECLERIVQRGRVGENKITLEFLQQLDKLYTEFGTKRGDVESIIEWIASQ